MQFSDFVGSSPDIRGGELVLRDTRIPLAQILAELADDGMIAAIAADLEISQELIRGAVELAGGALERLRKFDGNDDHPENRCDRCGGRNLHNWYADSDVWNRVAGNYSILCPICFSELARELGIAPTAWRLSIEGDDPEVSKLHTQLHARLKECAETWQELTVAKARVAQLEHEADCYACEICSPGEWTRGQCDECRRLDEAVQAAKEVNP